VVAHGVHVGTIDLGGLTAQQARARPRGALAPLRTRLVLRYSGGRFAFTPRALNLSVESYRPSCSALQ
jgi:hypothetical protein